MEEILLRLHPLEIDIRQIADGLEGEERDAHGDGPMMAHQRNLKSDGSQ